MALQKLNAKMQNVLPEFKGMEPSEVKSILNEKSFPVAVYADHWKGDYNLAMAIRNANAFGAKEFFYMGKKKFDPRHAVGSQFYTEIRYLEYLSELKELKKKYPLFVGMENNIPDCISIHDFEWPDVPTLILFGQEGIGLNKEVLELCDKLIYIPQYGSIRSLNVGTTSGIVLYDYVLKRLK